LLVARGPGIFCRAPSTPDGKRQQDGRLHLSDLASPLPALVLPGRAILAPVCLQGGEPALLPQPDLTLTTPGLIALATFVVAYGFIIAEEFTHLRKSKVILVVAGIIWALAAFARSQAGLEDAGELLRHNLEEYAELLLFLLAAMTYVNTLEERSVFRALRDRLVARGFSLRTVFWITGLLAFVLSPVLDNLTTALVMGAVVLSVGGGNAKFVALACINIVVAANAGGAFSPFGDITTLMVWQKGAVRFEEFFALVVPSAVNWLVPAIAMTAAVPRGQLARGAVRSPVKPGGWVVVALFAVTIAMTVALHTFLHLPPFLGMMTGLGLLKVYGFFIRRRELHPFGDRSEPPGPLPAPDGFKPATKPFDIFISMKRVEWDTLMFFYGVVLAVGGLAAFGYLDVLARSTYADLGATPANVLVGVASAVIDNIPIMFAVLSMDPEMPVGQWLLVTLTAGVGGSMLSIGSAAGVALMGQARGQYTFFAHLRWTWAVALGYALSILVHVQLNSTLFRP
jgi:Na+/H+ antiporter NhaD/arsenite permease-like protein